MKKITLSAAILALTMMGCSDTDVDNSMASTAANDVQNEQVNKLTEFPLLMKKASNPVSCGTGLDLETCYTRHYHGPEKLFYDFLIHSHVDPNFGTDISFMTVEVRDDPEGGHLFNPKANSIHMISVSACGCRMVRNHLKCTAHVDSVRHEANVYFWGLDGYANDQYIILDKPDQCNVNDVGVVTSFAAVFNAGKTSELILAGNTYHGPMFDNMSEDDARNLAERIYQKYILQPYGN